MPKFLRTLVIIIVLTTQQSCASRNQDDTEAQFQARVIGAQMASESIDETLLWSCNNASPSSYKNGVLKQKFWPNYVIKVYGSENNPTRSVFIEQSALEKILGEYIINSKESSDGLDIYTFVSTTDEAKLYLNMSSGTVIAQAELLNGLNQKLTKVELSCSSARFR